MHDGENHNGEVKEDNAKYNIMTPVDGAYFADYVEVLWQFGTRVYAEQQRKGTQHQKIEDNTPVASTSALTGRLCGGAACWEPVTAPSPPSLPPAAARLEVLATAAAAVSVATGLPKPSEAVGVSEVSTSTGLPKLQDAAHRLAVPGVTPWTGMT